LKNPLSHETCWRETKGKWYEQPVIFVHHFKSNEYYSVELKIEKNGIKYHFRSSDIPSLNEKLQPLIKLAFEKYDKYLQKQKQESSCRDLNEILKDIKRSK